MSLANKFLRYFHRVHFGENKKHNLVPSHLPQTKVGFTGTWSSGTTLIGGWWGGWGGGGEGGISKAEEFVYSHWLAPSSSLIWKHVVVDVVLWPNSRVHWPMQPRERTLQGSYPLLNKKFKDFSRTFKDTFPIFHFYCCGLAETTGSRWLNFVLHEQKVYLVFTQNIQTRALGFLQFLSKTTTFFSFE